MKPQVPSPDSISYPNRFTKFLWWLSTSEETLLKDTVVDANRHQIIGMTVLATWIFATVAWTYFFSTVVTNGWLAVPLGLFMGFIILTIDRALIKGINRFSTNKILPLLFRGLLAVTIGVFMAQPALLFMFSKEIKLQTSLDNEKRKLIKSQQLTALFKDKKSEFLIEKEKLTQEIAGKYHDVVAARQGFLAETDGSGGTGKVGLKAVALAKRMEYQKLDGEYQTLLSANQLKLAAADTGLKEINENIKKEQAAFETYFNDGFLTQIAALDNLLKANPALQLRYYLLVIILLLIELMPVIAKTMLPSGSYDEKAMLREKMEKEIALVVIEKEKHLRTVYHTIKAGLDEEALNTFAEITRKESKEKIMTFTNNWKDGPSEGNSLAKLWSTIKREMLLKTDL